MKKQHLTLLFAIISLSLSAQRLSLVPSHPMPGETVQIIYKPAGGPLEKANDIVPVAIFLDQDKIEAREINWSKQSDQYSGSLATQAGDKAFFIVLRAKGEDLKDDNESMGYPTLLYNSDRSTPVQGANAGIANGYIMQPYWSGVNRNAKRGLEWLKAEFAAYPSSKKIDQNILTYSYAAQQAKDEAAKADLRAIAEEKAAMKKPNEKALMLAYQIHQSFKDQDQMDRLKERMQKLYPKGLLIQTDIQNAFWREHDIVKKVDLFNQWQGLLGKEANADTKGQMAAQLAVTFAEQKKWAEFDRYMAMVTNPLEKAGSYNNLAWDLAGAGLDKEASDITRARDISGESVRLVETAISNPGLSKPPFYTLNQWKKSLESTLATYADTYALTLYRSNDVEGALKYQAIASKSNKFKDASMNERYSLYLEKAKSAADAQLFLEKAITEGVASPKMKSQYRQIFLANNSLEQALDKHMALLEKASIEAQRDEIRKKMIDLPAADFQLVNLQGESVSLAGLKGKVVILDFWATWCGPCKASFPGMQRAVSAFENNPNVVFLFVDTWESEGDKQKNAADFIAQNKYTFNVLMDNSSEVVAKYGVDGIPTKFVLDPQGHIRFKSVGYGGNEDALLEEMKTMIELAGGDALHGSPAGSN